jgi:hypothetical protein
MIKKKKIKKKHFCNYLFIEINTSIAKQLVTLRPIVTQLLDEKIKIKIMFIGVLMCLL